LSWWTGTHGIDGIVSKFSTKDPKSMMREKVPVDCKRANVTAIFKKDCRETAGNYRPVSLTLHVCKALESVIRNSIVEHINRKT
jgi:hypothetical protein